MTSPPPNQQFICKVYDAQGNTLKVEKIDAAWQAFFTDVYKGLVPTQQSGTTGQRPTKGLYIGRPYFDTSLGANGKPIWVAKDGVRWVLADGTLA